MHLRPILSPNSHVLEFGGVGNCETLRREAEAESKKQSFRSKGRVRNR